MEFMKKERFASRMKRMESNEMAEILQLAAIPGLISFAGGLPAPESFPVEKIKKSAVEVMDTLGRKALQYNTSKGYEPLRDWIAERMNNFGSKVKGKDILITSGSQQGIDLTGRVFLEKGDIVFTESPSYLGGLNALSAYECDFVEVPTDDEGMIPEDLEKLIEENQNGKFIYVIPDFQNPTGKTWTLERRKALLDIAKKQDLIVVEDNPYGELRYEGESIASIKSMDTDDRVIYLGTFSKILSPGIRIGWVAAGEEIMDKYLRVKQRTDVHTNSVTQMELVNFLENNSIDDHIQELIKLYGNRRDVMVESIEAYFPKDVKVTHPEGGLFLWLELPESINTKEMLKKAVDKNVGYVPGGAFYPNNRQENTIRLNFSNMKEDHIKEGIQILGAVIQEEL
jgi:2-aminoadipate transaminase